ncbi:16S rRNA (cytosine(1402)-N(4))-methyltransferase RsmH [bacterium]|nr:16S rRNA (cytosine(1402)-N(4))-methyltransferase RsmH [bacterium]
MMYSHNPVLLNEVIEFLNCKEGGVYVDCTLGLGGHAQEILKKIGSSGKLVGIDCDEDAINLAKKKLVRYKDNIIYVRDNFYNLRKIIKEKKITKVDGILFDFGVSSFQIENSERGFSFKRKGYLDMRMDKRVPFIAKDIVNNFTRKQIETIIYRYGEEKYASLIAKNIVKTRQNEQIVTTEQLVNVIKQAIPYKFYSKIHLATKTFQALRIEVNKELENIEQGLSQAVEFLKKGGRIAAISFHSLEDRIVKNKFREFSGVCSCPEEIPVCVCGRKKILNILTKKPILPTKKEIQINPRARSAKLRVAEKN